MTPLPKSALTSFRDFKSRATQIVFEEFSQLCDQAGVIKFDELSLIQYPSLQASRITLHTLIET